MTNALNPYESPQENEPAAAPETYYSMDFRRLTYAETWQISTNVIQFAVLAFAKMLHYRLQVLFAISPQGKLITAEELIPEAREAFAPLAQAAIEDGFHYGWTALSNTIGPAYIAATSFISDDRQSVLIIHYVRVLHIVKMVWLIRSLLSDERAITSTISKIDIQFDKQSIYQILPGQSILQVMAAHRRSLVELAGQVQTFTSLDDARAGLLRHSLKEFDLAVQRGFYTPISDAQYRAITKRYPQNIPVRSPANPLLVRFGSAAIFCLATWLLLSLTPLGGFNSLVSLGLAILLLVLAASILYRLKRSF